MRYIACQTDDCLNNGAPYHLEEKTTVVCPICGKKMTEIPDPTQKKKLRKK